MPATPERRRCRYSCVCSSTLTALTALGLATLSSGSCTLAALTALGALTAAGLGAAGAIAGALAATLNCRAAKPRSCTHTSPCSSHKSTSSLRTPEPASAPGEKRTHAPIRAVQPRTIRTTSSAYGNHGPPAPLGGSNPTHACNAPSSTLGCNTYCPASRSTAQRPRNCSTSSRATATALLNTARPRQCSTSSSL